MNYEVRDYQNEAIKTVFNKLASGVKNQLIVIATGLGKTYIATRIAEELEVKLKKEIRILFVAHREELIDQAAEAFNNIHPMNIGIIKGTLFEIDKKVVIASVQTLTNRLNRIRKNYFDIVFIDEVHHAMAPTYVTVANHFDPVLKIGLTATPERFDGLSLGNIFDDMVFEYNIDKGIANKFLCELQGIRTETNTDISKVKRVGNEFNKQQLSLVVNTPERNELVVEKYKKFADGRQGIFFCVDMKHAMDLNEAFIKNGIISEFVVSDENLCPDRKARINRFKDGTTQILTNVMILTEGFNHHDVGAIGMVRPTQSKTVYIQAIGRGTRPKSTKFIDRFGANNCIILDFVDNCGTHKLINTYSLDQGKKIEDTIFNTSIRKEKLIGVREERERKLKTLYKKDEFIDLLNLPKVEVFAQRGRMKEEATEKQINWLKGLGVWEEGIVYTKGHASELITNQPAAEWMIRILASWGYDVRENPTQGQYYAIKTKREEEMSVGEPSISPPFQFGNYD